MNKIFIAIILMLSILVKPMQAQKFGGGINIGLNASQIDGDNLNGYNQIGLTAGLNTTYDVSKYIQLNVEFLFSQRGSQSLLIPYIYEPLRYLTLNYIELPFYVTLKTFPVTNRNYSRFHVYGGISVGRIIDIDNQLANPEIDHNKFNKKDFSYLFGTKFFFDKHWAINGRFVSSINDLYTHPTDSKKNIRGFLFSFGIVFMIL